MIAESNFCHVPLISSNLPLGHEDALLSRFKQIVSLKRITGFDVGGQGTSRGTSMYEVGNVSILLTRLKEQCS